jgi:hypothetical protein
MSEYLKTNKIKVNGITYEIEDSRTKNALEIETLRAKEAESILESKNEVSNKRIDSLEQELNNFDFSVDDKIETAFSEVDEMINAAISEIIGTAPESLNTLQDIANWINNDVSGAAAMADKIILLQDQVLALSSGLKVSVSANPTSIYRGVDSSVSITVKLSDNSGNIIAEKLKAEINGNVQEATNVSSKVFTFSVNSSSSTVKVIAVSEYNGLVLNATTNITTCYPTYVGAGKTVNDVFEVNACKKKLTTSRTTYTITTTEDGQYFYLIVPNSGTTKPSSVKSFSMGGTPFKLDENVSQTLSGYTIYKSAYSYSKGTELIIKVE